MCADAGLEYGRAFGTRHTVLVDTGGFVGGRQTHFEATVLPALHQLGRRHIDHVIVSHSDADHAAGLVDLIAKFPNVRVWLGGNAEAPSSAQASACQAGEHWQLDEAHFSFLHPAAASFERPLIAEEDNDLSCVLLVQLGQTTILFPGDIERHGEQKLLSRLRSASNKAPDGPHVTDELTPTPAALGHSLTVLLAPHHGSITSSSQAFVDAWRPEHVVFPAGHLNRLGFPHAKVRMRYKIRGSTLYETGRDGALRFEFGPGGLLTEPTRYRTKHRRLWHASL